MKGYKSGSKNIVNSSSGSSLSRSGTGVPSNFAITFSTLLVVCMLFLFSTYYFHLRISTHPLQEGNMQKGGFVFNRLHGFNVSKNDTIADVIIEPISWVQIEEKARKDIEFYLNKLKGINHVDAELPVQLESTIPSTAIESEPPPLHELDCPHAELVTFWKKTTKADLQYKSPYNDFGPAKKYVTFEPDVGGWNNIRMQMELVLVFAYATGRTLVLPPDQPMYLLNAGKGPQKSHSFADFFPFQLIRQRFPVISMEEFLRREAITGHLALHPHGVHLNSSGPPPSAGPLYPPGNRTVFQGSERTERLLLWDYLRNVSACPQWKNLKDFLVIPPRPGLNTSLLGPAEAAEYQRRVDVAAAGRRARYNNDFWQRQQYIHFVSKPSLDLRLLEHFYTFLHFQDRHMDLFFKRFVRDYVHYTDTILCKAARIVHSMLREGRGSYVAFHIRRGDFQYKEMKLSADKILSNVSPFIPPGVQAAYVATDEKNLSFFKPFFQRFAVVRFLHDFTESADLAAINPNYLGMIDQVVCARGSMFTGTWFSTFSGYITRMRGYLGFQDRSVRYADMGHRDRFQHHELPKFPFYMREWNISWYNID